MTCNDVEKAVPDYYEFRVSGNISDDVVVYKFQGRSTLCGVV